MSKTLSVKSEGKEIYQIQIRNNFNELLPMLVDLGYQKDQKICIVTDSTVEKLYGDEVKSLLNRFFETIIIYCFEAGESSKNLQTVDQLYSVLINNHFERRDFLIALGGGVVGDLTGFTAATYLRGIDFIQVPTTLLSQVDSSIGGKTGVDFLQYKNMVGAFYQPKLVYMNLNVLKTLPQIQIISGMGEVLKHGLIKDKKYFQWMNRYHSRILSLDFDLLEELIYRSCDIKREVVERDTKEKGERALLNFGHTIGHAIEKLSGYQLYHGECVALGMIAASYLSCRMSHITEEDFQMIVNSLQTFGFKTTVSGYNPKEVLLTTKSDKKMSGTKVKFILLASIGNAYIYEDLADDTILDAIKYVCK